MRHPASHFFEFTPDTLKEWCAARSMPAFRASQILEWVYRKGVADPAKMTNLSARDRETLGREMAFLSGATVAERTATDGTRKLLIEWTDSDAPPTPPPSASTGAFPLTILGSSSSASREGGNDPDRQTECVMIPAVDEDTATITRKTACISSQVGCPVGCRFCASGMGGLAGNLSAGRIVEQVWRLQQLPGIERITNVVFMGMGEPLANFKAVTHAVRTLSAPWGMGIGARKITISTVGLPKAIERLAAELEVPVTLALSLHAPNDELRRKLIPWAEYTTIEDLLAACQGWFEKTGREITLEYTLLRGINDRREHAEQLSRVARTLRANVNLIRYNEVAGLGIEGHDFKRPRADDVLAFQAVLRARGVNTHIRRSRGRDIAAACGQLRHEAQRQAGHTSPALSRSPGLNHTRSGDC